MTEEDQDAALGRLVTRFSAAKRRRTALMSEANAFADALATTREVLGNPYQITEFSDGHKEGQAIGKSLGAFRPAYKSADEAQRLIDNIAATSKEIRDIRQQLKDAGLTIE